MEEFYTKILSFSINKEKHSSFIFSESCVFLFSVNKSFPLNFFVSMNLPNRLCFHQFSFKKHSLSSAFFANHLKKHMNRCLCHFFHRLPQCCDVEIPHLRCFTLHTNPPASQVGVKHRTSGAYL